MAMKHTLHHLLRIWLKLKFYSIFCFYTTDGVTKFIECQRCLHLLFSNTADQSKKATIFMNDAVEFLMNESKDLDVGYEVSSRENDSDEEALLLKEH